jgi:hypothetical protein
MTGSLRGVTLVSILFLACVVSVEGAGWLNLQGQISDAGGKAVTGAEIKVTDSSGKLRYQALSDSRGRYRLASLPALGDSGTYRLKISHRSFKSVEVADIREGARVSSPAAHDLALGQSFALLSSTRILTRNFVLSPAMGTLQSTTSTVDPNLAEYYYQQALLLLGVNKKKEAVDLLKLYTQVGSNPLQIERALTLITENE